MYNKLYEIIKEVDGKLDEIEKIINEKSLNEVSNIGVPDIRPSVGDITIKAYIFRISQWGKLNIVHKDTGGIDLGRITVNKFESLLTSPNTLKTFGKFNTKVLKINSLIISRTYGGILGKKFVEEFKITIDLKPELKKLLKS